MALLFNQMCWSCSFKYTAHTVGLAAEIYYHIEKFSGLCMKQCGDVTVIILAIWFYFIGLILAASVK